MIQVGQNVKHHVGNTSVYGATSNGFLYGRVEQVFQNGSYKLQTKETMIVMRDISLATPLTDDELVEPTQPIQPKPQTTTTHSKPTEPKQPKSVEPKAKVVRTRNTEGPSKKELAKELYDKMVASGVPFTRDDLKKAFQEQIGLTVAGSSTYSYYFM